MSAKRPRPVSPAPAAISRLPAARLARLLDPALPTAWSAKDAAAALRDQLSARLLPDLLAAPDSDQAFLQKKLAAAGTQTTFQKLLTGKSPDVELLRAVKALAAYLRQDAESPLHGDGATLLYYAAIAAALVAGTSITSLKRPELKEGLAWCLAQRAPARLRSLYHKAAAAVLV